MISKDNTRIIVTIKKKLHKKIKDLADRGHRPVSNLVNSILEEYFKN